MIKVFLSLSLFQEILDSLAELYSLLQEEDMWAGLWQKRCKFPETATAIAYEQHGFFEQVQRLTLSMDGLIEIFSSSGHPALLSVRKGMNVVILF